MNKIKLDEMKKQIKQAEELETKIACGKLAIEAICAPGVKSVNVSIVVWVDNQAYNLSEILDGGELRISIVKQLREALTELQAKYEAL